MYGIGLSATEKLQHNNSMLAISNGIAHELRWRRWRRQWTQITITFSNSNKIARYKKSTYKRLTNVFWESWQKNVDNVQFHWHSVNSGLGYANELLLLSKILFFFWIFGEIATKNDSRKKTTNAHSFFLVSQMNDPKFIWLYLTTFINF